VPYHHSYTVRRRVWSVWFSNTNAWIRKRISTVLATVLVVEVAQWFPVRTEGSAWNRHGTTVWTQTYMGAFKWIIFYMQSQKTDLYYAQSMWSERERQQKSRFALQPISLTPAPFPLHNTPIRSRSIVFCHTRSPLRSAPPNFRLALLCAPYRQ